MKKETSSFQVKERLKLLSWVMAMVMLIASFPMHAYADPATPSDTNTAVTKQKMYKWELVKYPDELRNINSWTPIILMYRYQKWEDDAVVAYGSEYMNTNLNPTTVLTEDEQTQISPYDDTMASQSVEYPEGTPEYPYSFSDEFYTTYPSNTFLKYADTNDNTSDGQGMPKCNLGYSTTGGDSPNIIFGADDGDDYWDKWSTGNEGNAKCQWTFFGVGGNGGYAKTISSIGRFKVYVEVYGSDISLYGESNGKITGADWQSYNYYTQFAVYKGTPYDISVFIDDYTIRSGQVLNLDDEVLLPEGRTITVEPGAVLSIDGRFYNNGTIKNYGTIILQKDSSITRLFPNNSSSNYGQIICSGSQYNLKAGLQEEIRIKTEEKEALGSAIETASQAAFSAKANREDLSASMQALLLKDNAFLEKKLSVSKFAVDEYQQELEVLNMEKKTLNSNIADIEKKNVASRTKDEQATLAYLKQLLAMKEVEITNKTASLNTATTEYNSYYDGTYTDGAFKAVDDDNHSVKYYDEEIATCNAIISSESALIVTNQKRIDDLEKRLSVLPSEDSVEDELVQGEGIFILLKNATAIFSAHATSSGDESLIVEDGGSIVCAGRIICDNRGIRLDDSRLDVLAGGAVLLGYKVQRGLLNIRNYESKNVDTLLYEIPSVVEASSDTCYSSLNLAGDYKIHVDGVVLYSNPIRAYTSTAELKSNHGKDSGSNSGVITGIFEGNGAWTKVAGISYTYDDQTGVTTTYDGKGGYRKTYPDGAVEVFAGSSSAAIVKTLTEEEYTTITTRQLDGSYVEEIKLTSGGAVVQHIEYASNGAVISGYRYIENTDSGIIKLNTGPGIVSIQQDVNNGAGGFLKVTSSESATYAYKLSKSDGTTITLERNDTDGITGSAVDINGKLLYFFNVPTDKISYTPTEGLATDTDKEKDFVERVSWTECVKTYPDHTEVLRGGVGLFNISESNVVQSATYTDGSYKNASYECADANFDSDFTRWTKGTLLWTVHASNGLRFTCRAAGNKGDRIVYCGADSGENANPYESAVYYSYADGGLPYPLKYLSGNKSSVSRQGRDYPLPIIESTECGWEDGVYKVPLTTMYEPAGINVERYEYYLDKECTLKANMNFTYGDFSGSSVSYRRWYLEDVTNATTCSLPAILWTVKSVDNKVVTCSAIASGSAVNNVQDVKWKIETEGGDTILWSKSNYASKPSPNDFLLTGTIPTAPGSIYVAYKIEE